MPRSLKKGPFVDDHLLKKVDDLNDEGREEGHQDLVAPLHDHPRHGRPHHRRARRPQARARVHHRVDGRSQARRVRARPARSATTPARRRTHEGSALMAFGTKTNERPRHAGRRSATCRVSAYKAREVLDLIRGLRRATTPTSVLRVHRARRRRRSSARCSTSAVANAEHNDADRPDELYVSACFADEGPTLKRLRPRARGRATRIRKRTCHITIIVSRLPDRRARAAPGRAAERRRRPARRAPATPPTAAPRPRVAEPGRAAAATHDHDARPRARSPTTRSTTPSTREAHRARSIDATTEADDAEHATRPTSRRRSRRPTRPSRPRSTEADDEAAERRDRRADERDDGGEA